MAKEKRKPGPEGDEKPMGMTSRPDVGEEIVQVRAEMEQIKEKLNEHYRYHFRRKAL